jgi:hypothetical protein
MKTALILLLATICIAPSCKKEGQKPNEGTKLVKLENTFRDGNFWNRTFKLNSADKMISYEDSTSWGGIASVTVEYGANGKPSRADYRDHQNKIIFYFEFEYNAEGRVSKRQAKPGTINIADDYNIYAYDVAGHMIADSQYSRASPDTFWLIKVNRFTYTGDNLTEAEYLHVLNGDKEKMKFEYDDGLNPLKNLDNYYLIIESNSNLHDIGIVSSNNVVKEYAATGNGPYELVQNYKYQYNSSNYPWKRKAEINHNSQELLEVEYFYKQ